MEKKKESLLIRKRLLKHAGKVCLAIISASMMVSPSLAIDPSEAAAEVIGAEGSKIALEQALKLTRSRPALTVAGIIVCGACVPAAGVAASPAMCIACGILIAKVIG